MFCGEAPCVCNAKPKAPAKAKVPAKPKAEPKAKAPAKAKTATKATEDEIIESAPKPNVMAAMKARAETARPETAVVKPAPMKYVPKTAERDEVSQAEFDRAIQALGPIMHPKEVAKYSDTLNAPPVISKRVQAWREGQDDESAG